MSEVPGWQAVRAARARRSLVRLVGRAPIEATVYELEKLRCSLCLEVFTAQAPPEAGDKKYDETAASMMALLKYGYGVPFYRLDTLQSNLGIPLPPSTQWGVSKRLVNRFAWFGA